MLLVLPLLDFLQLELNLFDQELLLMQLSDITNQVSLQALQLSALYIFFLSLILRSGLFLKLLLYFMIWKRNQKRRRKEEEIRER